jgi:hypothetical protein
MLSLFDEIKRLQVPQWDYYHFHSKRSLKFPEFNGNKQSAKFIKSYFKRGGKEKLLKSYFRITDSLLSRSGHTVSIFFMGILIYSHTKIKKYMDWGENCYRRNGTMPKSPVLGMPVGGMSAPRPVAGAGDKAASAGRPGSRPGGFQLGFIFRDRFR